MPGAFKLNHLLCFKPLLSKKIFNFFTFILGSPFLLPQRANFGSWENFPSPNMDDTEGFECLGHSNWTICSPLSPFCSEKFPTFSLSYWGANSYYPRGLILGVGRISHLPIWMTQRGLSAEYMAASCHMSYFALSGRHRKGFYAPRYHIWHEAATICLF